MQTEQCQRKGPPLWEARSSSGLAAAVVIAAAAAVLLGAAADAALVAAAAEQDEQDDDPQTVVAAEAVVVIHRITSGIGIWSGFAAHSMLFRRPDLVTAGDFLFFPST